MQFELRLGQKTIPIHLEARQVHGSFRGPGEATPQVAKTIPVDEVEAFLAERLEHPVAAPPLREAMFPGDSICLLWDSSLNLVASILIPVVERVVTAVGPDGAIQIVCLGVATAQSTEYRDQIQQLLAQQLPNIKTALTIHIHDPANTTDLGYLASTEHGQRIYLHRSAIDADLLVVIGPVGPNARLGFQGPASLLFPGASDQETLQHSQRLALELRHDPDLLRQRQHSDEVAWLRGFFYSIAVSLDRQQQVDQLWVGQAHAVQQLANEYAKQHWLVDPPPQRPELVLVSLAPSYLPDTWQSVGAALETAGQLFDSGMQIALLTDLAEPMGPGIALLRAAHDPYQVIQQVRQAASKDFPDLLPAAQFANVLHRHRLYLWSQLPEAVVQDLDIVPIANLEQLQALVQRCHSCFLVEDADRAQVLR